MLRGPHARLHPSLTSKTFLQRPALLQARFAASSVSNKPGSQTFEHAAQNVKEEVGNSAADWAKTIAGGNFTQDSVKIDKDPTFVNVTVFGCLNVLFTFVYCFVDRSNERWSQHGPNALHGDGSRRYVSIAIAYSFVINSLSGGLPYIAASGTTVYLAHQAGLAISGVATNIDPGVAHTILDQALTFQVTYGAVMLSFLGKSLALPRRT